MIAAEHCAHPVEPNCGVGAVEALLCAGNTGIWKRVMEYLCVWGTLRQEEGNDRFWDR